MCGSGVAHVSCRSLIKRATSQINSLFKEFSLLALKKSFNYEIFSKYDFLALELKSIRKQKTVKKIRVSPIKL